MLVARSPVICRPKSQCCYRLIYRPKSQLLFITLLLDGASAKKNFIISNHLLLLSFIKRLDKMLIGIRELLEIFYIFNSFFYNIAISNSSFILKFTLTNRDKRKSNKTKRFFLNFDEIASQNNNNSSSFYKLLG